MLTGFVCLAETSTELAAACSARWSPAETCIPSCPTGRVLIVNYKCGGPCTSPRLPILQILLCTPYLMLLGHVGRAHARHGLWKGSVGSIIYLIDFGQEGGGTDDLSRAPTKSKGKPRGQGPVVPASRRELRTTSGNAVGQVHTDTIMVQ